MKKFYLLLAIIPVCFIIYFVAIRHLEGPYYSGNADPSYAYLVNSLSLAQMNGSHIGHVDHPGTPLQLAGAVVLKICYTFNHKYDDITEDVIRNPEPYITAIDYFLIFLNASGLYLMGLIIFNVKKNIFICFLFQIIPWISINITEVFSLVKTESFSFCLMLILIALMFKFIYNPPSRMNFFVGLTGVLCGLILSVKIGFLCIAIIPLIIFKGFKNKLRYLVTAFISFVVFVLPAMSNIDYFLKWVGKLILYNDRYGRGDSNVINSGSFFTNISKIIFNEKLFAAIYFISLIVIIISLINYKKRETSDTENNPGELKFLVAIFAAMSIQIVFVAKHYSHRYMFPALVLMIPALYLLVSIVYRRFLSKVNFNFVIIPVLVFSMLISALNSKRMASRSIVHTREANKLYDFVKSNYPDSKIIVSSGASHEFTGMMMMTSYAGDNIRPRYVELVNQRFPKQPWYDIFNNRMYALSDTITALSLFNTGKPLLYQSTDTSFNKPFTKYLETNYKLENVELRKVFSNTNDDAIYEVTAE